MFDFKLDFPLCSQQVGLKRKNLAIEGTEVCLSDGWKCIFYT